MAKKTKELQHTTTMRVQTTPFNLTHDSAIKRWSIFKKNSPYVFWIRNLEYVFFVQMCKMNVQKQDLLRKHFLTIIQWQAWTASNKMIKMIWSRNISVIFCDIIPVIGSENK